MDFMYAIAVDTARPIMLIDTHVGYYEEDGPGIDGARFCRELFELDTMGKECIQVWINSPGGIVADGYNIYNAILRTKTKVDTYCVGIAASIAGVIFQAGRSRIMADYGCLMYHNAANTDGSEDKSLKAFNATIATMIASRSGKSEKEVLKIMDRETWILADEALEQGFCDSIEASSDKNKRKLVGQKNIRDSWGAANLILNKATEPFKKPKNRVMSFPRIANKLGLHDEASENAIMEMVDKVMNKAKDAEKDLKDCKDEMEKCKKDMEDLKKAHKDKSDEYEDLKKKHDELKKKMDDAEEEDKQDKVKNLLTNAVNTGRIAGDEKTIAAWTTRASKDFKDTEDLLNAMPASRNAPQAIQTSAAQANDKALLGVVASTMNALRQRERDKYAANKRDKK